MSEANPKDQRPSARATEFRLHLFPDDYERAREFYQGFLGYQPVKVWDHGVGNRGVLLDAGVAIIELMDVAGYPPNRCSVAIEVEDVWKLWDSLKDEARVFFPLRHNAWGDTSFRIEDPAGFLLTFFTKDAPDAAGEGEPGGD